MGDVYGGEEAEMKAEGGWLWEENGDEFSSIEEERADKQKAGLVVHDAGLNDGV